MSWWAWLLVAFFFWPLLLMPLLWWHEQALKAAGFGYAAVLRYTGVQLLSWWATVVGWFLLAWPCWRQRWTADAESNNQLIFLNAPRVTIDRWAWAWLNSIWGNPEDGVSGCYALIRDATGALMPYMPFRDPRWRAYWWSAWRNSADGLKYLCAWEAGPFVELTLFGRQVKFGWKLMGQLKGSPRLPVLG